jgi:hypothetical protein
MFPTVCFQGIEIIDNIELKRQKVRERYASLTKEQKAHKNSENNHRKKAESRATNMTRETISGGTPSVFI